MAIPGTTYDPNQAAQEAMAGAPGQQIEANSQVPEASDIASAAAGGARSTAQGAAGAAGLSGAAGANAGAQAGANTYGSTYAQVAPELSEQKVQQQGIRQGAQTAQRGQTMDYGTSIAGQGTQLANTAENIAWQQKQAEMAQQGSLLQDLFQGGTALAGDAILMSDKRAKTNIRDSGDMLKAIADNIRGHKFFYKSDPEHEEVGVMAQDLEKTPLKSSVIQASDGTKMVDTRRLTTANTAMISDLARKLDKAFSIIGGIK